MSTAPSMPEAEAAHLIERYRDARVILEYGSGGSTRIASQMPGKLILSVESDRAWTRDLRREIAQSEPRSQVILHHVDIGPTGAWGRARNDRSWRQYHRYPNEVWDMPFFRHPDVILIDGRFRTACLMTAILRITRPVVVLFDDYTDRPKYQLVERLLRPARLIGRMAEFRLQPGMARAQDLGFVFGQYFAVTLHGRSKNAYEIDTKDKKGPVA
jgi:hypothetical protein